VGRDWLSGVGLAARPYWAGGSRMPRPRGDGGVVFASPDEDSGVESLTRLDEGRAYVCRVFCSILVATRVALVKVAQRTGDARKCSSR